MTKRENDKWGVWIFFAIVAVAWIILGMAIDLEACDSTIVDIICKEKPGKAVTSGPPCQYYECSVDSTIVRAECIDSIWTYAESPALVVDTGYLWRADSFFYCIDNRYNPTEIITIYYLDTVDYKCCTTEVFISPQADDDGFVPAIAIIKKQITWEPVLDTTIVFKIGIDKTLLKHLDKFHIGRF